MAKKKNSKNSLMKLEKQLEREVRETLGANKAAMSQRFEVMLAQMEEKTAGKVGFIDALLSSRDPEAKRLIKALGAEDNQELSVLDICKKLDLYPGDVVAMFGDAVMAAANLEGYIKLAASLPEIVDSAVTSSQLPGKEGFSDREMLLKISGMLPEESKGVKVNVQQNVGVIGQPGGFERIAGATQSMMQENPFEAEAVETIDAGSSDV